MGGDDNNHDILSESQRLKECLADLEISHTRLHEMQCRYECLFDRSLECIYVHDLEGNFLDANQAALDLLGYTKLEIQSLNFLSLLDEHQMALAFDILEAIVREGKQMYAIEFKLKRADGKIVFVETRAAPLYRDGQAFALLGVAKDVTERKAYEEALQESERNFRSLAENANAGILVISDEQGRFVYANRIAADICGYGISELMQKTIADIVPPERYATLFRRYRNIVAGREVAPTYEAELIHKSGRTVPVSITSARTYWHGSPADMIIVNDISEYQQAQALMMSLLKEKAEILDVMGDGLLVVDIHGTIIATNQAYEGMSGRTNDEILGVNCFDLAAKTLPPDDVDLLRRTFPTALAGQPLPIMQCTLMHADGHEIPTSFTTSYLRDQGGKPRAMILVIKDMTDRKRKEDSLQRHQEELERRVVERTSDLMATNARLEEEIDRRLEIEASLSESEEKYRSLVENINDMIFRLDGSGVFTYASPAVLRLFGFAPQELIGRSMLDFVLPEDSQLLKGCLAGTREAGPNIEEFRVYDNHRRVRWVQASSRPVQCDDRSRGIQGVITDITQKKLLEQRLIPAERMASTGQLAASIAHEINSPLQAITITLASLRKTLSADHDLVENLELLREAFTSIREAVKNLLDLNRPGMEEKKACSINAIIEKTVSLMNAQLKQTRVKVNLTLSQGLPPIMASIQQLGQVFLNLINNAIDAMAGEHLVRDEYHHQASGGTITISTMRVGERIIAEFSDSGPGLQAATFEDIFDPFFTQGKKTGMGIGLSICRSIIEAHQGTITARNAPGGGALFTISLPIEPFTQGDNHARF